MLVFGFYYSNSNRHFYDIEIAADVICIFSELKIILCLPSKRFWIVDFDFLVLFLYAFVQTKHYLLTCLVVMETSRENANVLKSVSSNSVSVGCGTDIVTKKNSFVCSISS